MKTQINITLARVRRAFSLIEVLMATLILGLGLLGLGAVLPVVLRQQTTSADTSLGTSAVQSSIEYIESRRELRAEQWKNLILAYGPGAVEYSLEQRWLPLPMFANGDLAPFPRWVQLQYSGSNVQITASPWYERVPLADRLYPNEASGEREPQFVWDMVARRDFKAGGVQLAVFVRRVDGNIGKGLDRSARIFEALLSPGSATPRFAVAVDAEGRPTYDGGGVNNAAARYSQVLTAQVGAVVTQSGAIIRDRLLIVAISDPGRQGGGDPTPALISYLTQPGQKLVDNLGNIYTVEGLDPASSGSTYIVRLVNPIPSGCAFANVAGDLSYDANLNGGQSNLAPRRAAIREVAFTPQIPVAVEVLTKKFDMPANPFRPETPISNTGIQP